MGRTGHLYQGESAATATHLALNWRGRLRFVVPRNRAAQRATWQMFRPGRIRIVFEPMTRLPRLLGAGRCSESAQIASIRTKIGLETGFSCCRTGAGGPWSKDTLLLLDEKANEPLCFAKTGAGAAIDRLLQNEADWLRRLRDETALAGHVPALVAHCSAEDFHFLVQSPVCGSSSFSLGEPHFDFLRKLQAYSERPVRYQDSILHHSLHARMDDLDGLLPTEWSERISKATRKIEAALGTSSAPFVAAHNDFTPWNTRLRNGIVSVFDWEFAAHEQLPLFDPLHFAMSPLARQNKSRHEIIRAMDATILSSRRSLGVERCNHPEIQALAYMVNLCTLYMWADRGTRNSHPMLVSYAGIVDTILSS